MYNTILSFLKQKSTIQGIIVGILGIVAMFEGLPATTVINVVLVLFGFDKIVIEDD